MRPSWFCYLLVWSSLVEQEAISQSTSVGVELEATLPLTREAIESVRLDARLYAYDPFLADASADLVDQTIIEPLMLASDRESLVRLNLGGNRLPRMDYYVSVRVYRITDGLQIFFNDRCFRCLWERTTPR